ncbi:PTS sugar transporter subunit IIA [Ammoniphilus sp. 3BR4]|uniref:PTS sugar transporter subunit IIA n=1 Tax=Ammoniphilus sp. 3BR4 TaxID=3158265 RepID=UPI003466732E
MTKKLNLDENLIFIDVDREEKEDVIGILAGRLEEHGYVKETFLNAILSREQVYPTGLPLQKYGVAIPHTDAVHVNEPAMAVAVLTKPIQFQMMGSQETDVSVDMVFLLAIKEPSEQISMLESLMNMFQNEEVMDSLRHASSSSEAKIIIEREMKLSIATEVV